MKIFSKELFGTSGVEITRTKPNPEREREQSQRFFISLFREQIIGKIVQQSPEEKKALEVLEDYLDFILERLGGDPLQWKAKILGDLQKEAVSLTENGADGEKAGMAFLSLLGQVLETLEQVEKGEFQSEEEQKDFETDEKPEPTPEMAEDFAQFYTKTAQHIEDESQRNRAITKFLGEQHAQLSHMRIAGPLLHMKRRMLQGTFQKLKGDPTSSNLNS
jgi:hypothetical protein